MGVSEAPMSPDQTGLSPDQIPMQDRARAFLLGLQDEITAGLESIDGAMFTEDSWQRPGGGGGRTRVMIEGNIFEKAGVNFSAVHGEAPAHMNASRTRLTFFASGVSLVLHPRSPMIPTVHANFRYFELSDGRAWFGGGSDLTPYYLDESDAEHFHTQFKLACDKHDVRYYPRFKRWCDEYFFIKHRNESRGIGGIFFDDLGGSPAEREDIFNFVQEAGRAFLPAYLPIVEKHRNDSFGDAEKRWQLLRRGRYVEFNLVYDRGTRFGLETNGRIESILMSLPTLARWEYDMHPEPNSREAALVDVLQHPRDWVTVSEVA